MFSINTTFSKSIATIGLAENYQKRRITGSQHYSRKGAREFLDILDGPSIRNGVQYSYFIQVIMNFYLKHDK